MNRYPDILTRVLTATLGAVIIILSIVKGQWSYFVVFLIIATLAQREFYRIVKTPGARPLKNWGTLMGIMVVSYSFFSISGLLNLDWLLIFIPLGMVTFIFKLFQENEPQPFLGTAYTWLGIIYVTVPFSVLHYIGFAFGTYDFQLVLGCLLLHWAHDVGAYFVGVRYGKTKLFERLSPKKSWEGSMGGLFLTILVVFIGSFWADSLKLWEWMIIGVLVVVAGTLGDLVESQLKRSLEIKDSGKSIPGHGGFLDRFDGLLISTPFIAAFLKFFVV
ncbi:MAG: phosphatidate cytidylyltransferase [Cyclobacteriaceae bacterium]|nr:MAG: phosphatidate cytidylyltransferase [Cyclobacteriaceae bacterium]